MQIVVATKNEVKLYDSANGKLVKIHLNMANELKQAEITALRQDAKHRKCYVADSIGDIKVYNINSGVELKDVTEFEKEGKIDLDDRSLNSEDYHDAFSEEEEEKLEGQLEEDSSKKKEITDMELVWEDDYILMICCDSNSYYVYDEDDTDVSYLLREVTGGHKEEISIIRYCDHLGLLATGSVDGEVCVWDFEMSKIEGICLGHKQDVTAIEFLEPYPLMLTASLDGYVCLWGVRPCPIQYKSICIIRFKNVSWQYSEDLKTAVTKLQVLGPQE